MNRLKLAAPCIVLAGLAAGCQNMSGYGTDYGETSGVPLAGVSEYQRQGSIIDIDRVRVDDDYRFGIGTVVGAIAGGLLGHQIGGGSGNTLATIAGTVAGGTAGTAAESKMKGKLAQRVTVDMRTGGTVTVVQPTDPRLRNGMRVAVIGRGESARVVPR